MARISITKTWDDQPLPEEEKYQLQLSLSPTSGDLTITVLDAPLTSGSIPTAPPGRMEKLHEHDVVELFIAGGKPPAADYAAPSIGKVDPYLEVQLGPYGHYFLAFFIRQADWATQDTALEIEELPECHIDQQRGRWSGSISIPSFLLPEPLQQKGDDGADLVGWRVNACAIHTTAADISDEGTRVHAMLAPCRGPSPNFHRIDCCHLLTMEEAPHLCGLVDRMQSFALERINTITGATSGSLSPPSAAALKSVSSTSMPPDPPPNSSSSMCESLPTNSMTSSSLTPNQSIITANSIAENKSPVQAVAEQLRDEFHERQLIIAGIAAADAQLPPALQLDACFLRHVHKEEFVVMHGIVTKRKGISFKSRRLILTSTPRLMYFDSKGSFKGNISWHAMKGLKVEKVAAKKFDITLHDRSRTYHFTVKAGDAEEWVDSLNRLLKAQRMYLRASLRS